MDEIKIITGGQTGADRAALDIAVKYQLDYCGYIPKGRLAEDGTVPEKYTSLLVNKNAQYSSRTLKNVLCALGVILFFENHMDEGTNLTRAYAIRFRKPIIEVNVSEPFKKNHLQQFINRHKVVNIAGPRQSNAPGIYEKVYALLEEVFKL